MLSQQLPRFKECSMTKDYCWSFRWSSAKNLGTKCRQTRRICLPQETQTTNWQPVERSHYSLLWLPRCKKTWQPPQNPHSHFFFVTFLFPPRNAAQTSTISFYLPASQHHLLSQSVAPRNHYSFLVPPLFLIQPPLSCPAGSNKLRRTSPILHSGLYSGSFSFETRTDDTEAFCAPSSIDHNRMLPFISCVISLFCAHGLSPRQECGKRRCSGHPRILVRVSASV